MRGNTIKFYEWLETTSGKALPEGPPVWICGDCHVVNLGPIADLEGRVEIQIRDLDQAVIGNPAHDLNGGDGFGTGCVTFTTKTTCIPNGQGDQMFTINCAAK